MSFPARVINKLWMLSCRRELARFQHATFDVEKTQRDLLREMITGNRETQFGREHDFASLNSHEDLANRVPVSEYDYFHPYIERISRGESGVLTADPVLLLEPTSGSTDGRKLIPYTNTLRTQMQRALSAWIADLFAARPAVRRGKSYWSISPAMGVDEKTAGGTRIGFADDTEYLGTIERRAIRQVLAVDPKVAKHKLIERFRDETLVGLLLSRDLALVSIWSPTFLTSLIDELFESNDSLIRTLYGLNRTRAREVESVLNSARSLPEKLAELWPSLALISCWTDGSAADYLPLLKQRFPGVEIQSKGLLATEAFFSFPLVGRDGCALAIRSHFFEFLDSNSSDAQHSNSGALLAHQLVQGGSYIPVVTTGGGLYRYRTNDIVQVTGFESQCPLIRFTGRTNHSSDLVGEKLEESFVRRGFAEACEEAGIKVTWSLLLPIIGPLPRYRLYLDLENACSLSSHELSAKVESRLRRNPQYLYARELGQLAPLEVNIRDVHKRTFARLFEQACVDCGMKPGDIKPAILCNNRKIAEQFRKLSEFQTAQDQ